MILTSYYSKLRSIPIKYTPIQISNSAPFHIDYKWNEVVPPWKIVQDHKSGIISNEEYCIRYVNHLDSIGIDRYKDWLDSLVGSSDMILLLCYESPNKFCHRHILSNYLNNKFNYNIREYQDD